MRASRKTEALEKRNFHKVYYVLDENARKIKIFKFITPATSFGLP